jgi:plastocyanin
MGVVVAMALANPVPSAAADITVSMAGMSYSPRTLNARVGDVIKFKNDDTETHAVFVPTKGFGVNLGTQKANETAELVLSKAGTFDVECVLHEDMHMRVVVGP